jgi:hypothetical protein
MARKQSSSHVPAYLEGLVKKKRDGWYYRRGSGAKYPWIGPFQTQHVAEKVREGETGGPWGTARPAHSTIGEESTPTRAALSNKIKQALRDLYGLKVKMRTNQTKSPFINAWIPFEGDRPSPSRFPADLRNAALDVVYGEEFARNRSEPGAGNVEGHSIALKAPQWIETFRRLGHTL